MIGTFTLPATATSLTVPVTALKATDNVAVTGYLVTTSSTKPLASATGWSATAPTSVTAPAAGSVTFYAWAKDAAGHVSAGKSATVKLSAVAENLEMEVSTLADGSYTRNRTLNVNGTVSDPTGIKSLTVNGSTVGVNPDGSFSTAWFLNSGKNTIKVIATNKIGCTKTDTRTVTYSTSLPEMSVSSPADNIDTIKSFIEVKGNVGEQSRVTVKVNDASPQNAAISGENSAATVNLTPGINTIYIDTIDQAGHVSSAKRSVLYNNGSFSIAVTSPAQDMTTNLAALTLKGNISDALNKVSVSITMAGRTYAPAVVNGVFQQRLTFTTAGLYKITVKAKDTAGNINTVIRNVIFRPGTVKYDN